MSNVEEICDNWENCDFKWKNSFFGTNLLRYVSMWKTTLLSAKGIMEWKSIAEEKEHSKQLANMTINLEFSENNDN